MSFLNTFIAKKHAMYVSIMLKYKFLFSHTHYSIMKRNDGKSHCSPKIWNGCNFKMWLRTVTAQAHTAELCLIEIRCLGLGYDQKWWKSLQA